MNVQIAMDSETIGSAVQKATLVRDYVDVIEMGTGFLYRNGLSVVTEFKHLFPEKKILADMKLVDGGKHLAEDAFNAGADIVTVLAMGEYETISGAVQAANERGKEILADLIAAGDYTKYKDKMDEIGVHYVCAHMAVDTEQSDNNIENFLKQLKNIKFKAKLALAGGIKTSNIANIAQYSPDLLVVGRAITQADDIVAAAKMFKEA